MPAARSRPSKKPKRDPHTAYRARAKRVRAAMADLGLDALLITNEKDIRYLTPFPGDDSVAVLGERSLTVVSDFRFEEDLGALKGLARVVIRDGEMVGALKGVVEGLAPSRLGVQAEHMSVVSRKRLARAVGSGLLKDTEGLVAGVRETKDEAEVRLIRRAVRIQEAALEATLAEIGPGWTEREVAALLEHEMKSRGAEGSSFPIIAAAGANGSKPHAVPGGRKLAANRPLLIDWGARYEGYCSDMTRVFTFGRWRREIREIYRVVLEAFEAGKAAVRAGARCVDVDAAARGVIERAGYGGRFGHGLGHGIGLDIHESPRLAKRSRGELREGMVVTIEPGVYLPGVGGVRIEDDVLVTAKGGRGLCSLPTDLGWATL
jgi:Xaa-Pro aminopeptidase